MLYGAVDVYVEHSRGEGLLTRVTEDGLAGVVRDADVVGRLVHVQQGEAVDLLRLARCITRGENLSGLDVLYKSHDGQLLGVVDSADGPRCAVVVLTACSHIAHVDALTTAKQLAAGVVLFGLTVGEGRCKRGMLFNGCHEQTEAVATDGCVGFNVDSDVQPSIVDREGGGHIHRHRVAGTDIDHVVERCDVGRALEFVAIDDSRWHGVDAIVVDAGIHVGLLRSVDIILVVWKTYVVFHGNHLTDAVVQHGVEGRTVTGTRTATVVGEFFNQHKTALGGH